MVACALTCRCRAQVAAFGLCQDEFTDMDHWPEQLYVREAFRMVGDVVFTQATIEANRGKNISNSIGMGSYNYDRLIS